MSTPQDPPDSALAAWRVTPVRDPAFRTAVWQRIERAQSAGNWRAFVRAHRAVVAGAFALALALGAMLGRQEARARVSADSRRLADEYVQSLDARFMRMR
jgi:hypothetical protein